jgi:hypothetical protein
MTEPAGAWAEVHRLCLKVSHQLSTVPQAPDMDWAGRHGNAGMRQYNIQPNILSIALIILHYYSIRTRLFHLSVCGTRGLRTASYHIRLIIPLSAQHSLTRVLGPLYQCVLLAIQAPTHIRVNMTVRHPSHLADSRHDTPTCRQRRVSWIHRGERTVR